MRTSPHAVSTEICGVVPKVGGIAGVVEGSCMERENLAGDGKGKGASGSNREAESTDAPERGGMAS